ncbi:uncharacterized protein ACLA_065020 [Aspergillus clavatus NRRL 1]|uniref:Uncharacterized protein n=1 Tax=Aspergillus clavatus (strain ATCC 1007 / CBS 513.65 / DSM 816 / NCTC 3887 / NRRL 1 / QM 1276 / 107) TaxID=344612 RepID=A1CFZ0_ASPCL|nr:uncharacterized protein ACLA_065020 [Aspergillus clavatus NRRL 1]EAW10870.1 hypothetical protein ACLA_065020 [Aspergillus clavatus NRRL 1]
MSSRPSHANQSASRDSSIQPSARGSSTERDQALDQLQRSPDANEKNHQSESYDQVSAPKKEKRVTRRLEAERLELEKRLLKLEQAQLSRDHTSSKRESRRLTKKQPIESSSRGSSVSADESRSSSRRFSAFFSSSRRTSRSRTSVATEKEDDHLTTNAFGTKETPTDNAPTPRVGNPPLFTSLPERFSAVVSKGLAVESDTLLQSFTPPMQSQSPVPAVASPEDDAGKADERPQRDGEGRSVPRTLKLNAGQSAQAGQRINTQERLSYTQKPPTSSDMDRDSFAATLNLAQRSRESNQTHHRSLNPALNSTFAQKDAAQSENHHQLRALESSKSRVVSDKANGAMITSGSSSAKAPASNASQKLPRMTKPSPLAIGNSIGSTSSESVNGNNRTSPVRNSIKSNGARRVPTSPLVTVSMRIPPTDESLQVPQPSVSKKIEGMPAPHAPTERTSWSLHGATSSVLGQPKPFPSDAPRHWQSNRWSRHPEPIADSVQEPQPSTTLGKKGFYAPSNYGHDSKSDVSLANQGEDRDTSVLQSVKIGREDGNLPEHSPRRKADSEDTAPASSSSSRTSSPEPCSEDYNTADEAGSIKSVLKRGGDRSDHQPSSAPDTCSMHDDPRIRRFTHVEEYPVTTVSRVEDSQPDRLARKLGGAETSQPVMKNFAICCACKSWHEMPAKVYSKVSSTEALPVLIKYGSSANKNGQKKSSRLTRSTTSVSRSTWPRKLSTSKRSPGEPQKPQLTAGSFAQCCWCTHHMNRQCCEGWTASVQMHERHRW